MANERLFLKHAPSGYSVYLGKRMGWGYYDAKPDIHLAIQRLFDMVESQEADGDQDEFVAALDDEVDYEKLVEPSYKGFIGRLAMATRAFRFIMRGRRGRR